MGRYGYLRLTGLLYWNCLRPRHWPYIIRPLYCDWTGVFQIKSSHFSLFYYYSLCCTPQSDVSDLRPSCVAVRLSERSGCTPLHGSDCEMSPFNMLMSQVPMVPLGERLTLLDRCVCMSVCWRHTYTVCMSIHADTNSQAMRTHTEVSKNVWTCVTDTHTNSYIYMHKHFPCGAHHPCSSVLPLTGLRSQRSVETRWQVELIVWQRGRLSTHCVLNYV